MTKDSRYPEKMSARRARFEAERARTHRRRLPVGHPYALVPTWVPFTVAQVIGALHNAVMWLLGDDKRRSRRY